MQWNDYYYTNEKLKCPDSVRGSQFGHLYKWMLRATLAYFHLWTSPRLKLSGCHYSKHPVTWINENVKFVSKEINPPIIFQARSVENFWGCLAQKVYEGGWEAKTKQQLITLTRRIECKMKGFDAYFVESLLEWVKAKVRSIDYNGIYALFRNKWFISKKTKVVIFFLSLDI